MSACCVGGSSGPVRLPQFRTTLQEKRRRSREAAGAHPVLPHLASRLASDAHQKTLARIVAQRPHASHGDRSTDSLTDEAGPLHRAQGAPNATGRSARPWHLPRRPCAPATTRWLPAVAQT